VKRKSQILSVLAALIFFTRLVDLYWLITPAFFPQGVHIHWLDLVLLIAIGGGWAAVFLRQWAGRSPLPRHDPHLGEVHDQHDRFAGTEQTA
jgi:hypothetical protein